MLTRLQIENYALIDRAVVEFGPGLNVLSGETGSGKSMVVDALGLLLGGRAELGAIRAGSERASVVGSFVLDGAAKPAVSKALHEAGLDLDEDDLIVRREIAANGRGRVLINHQSATVALLRQIAPLLAAVHSQHESLAAFAPPEQLALLDRYAMASEARQAVASAHAVWRACAERQQELAAAEQKRLQDLDLWRFQAEELEAAQLSAGEDLELDRERERLLHAERIATSAEAAWSLLYDAPEAAASTMKGAVRHIQELARFEPSAAALAVRLEAARGEVEDVAAEVRSWREQGEASPERLEAVEQRRAYLDRLKRKYGPSLDDVVRYGQELAGKIETAERAEELAAAAAGETEAAAAAYRQAAARLSALRRQAGAALAPAIEAEVADLAMKTRFQIELNAAAEDEARWTAEGWDAVRFLASTNPGEPVQPLSAIASGGELSRVLLALQVVIEAGGGKKPSRRGGGEASRRTLVFDEVDAGIGGRTAEAVGRKLRELSADYQILSVTHLAQIATFAAQHLRVEKAERNGRTLTNVTALSGRERIEEVARMLAGNHLNETSLKHAQELLAAHA